MKLVNKSRFKKCWGNPANYPLNLIMLAKALLILPIFILAVALDYTSEALYNFQNYLCSLPPHIEDLK